MSVLNILIVDDDPMAHIVIRKELGIENPIILREIPLMLIQKINGENPTAEKLQLMAGQPLGTAPKAELLSPFIKVVESCFKKKGL